jgi:alpha-galactosidase
MAIQLRDFIRIDGAASTLVVGFASGLPAVSYWGVRLPDGIDLAALARLGVRAEANASPAVEPVLALTPLAGQGSPGRPGLAAHRDGRDWASWALVSAVEATTDRAVITSLDPVHELELIHNLAFQGDVLVATTTLTNRSAAPLTVDEFTAPVLPLPGFVDRIIGFEGRWAGEFMTRANHRTMGTWLRENRRGRTSHDSFPGLIAAEAATTEAHGLAYGFHLGWSGNHRLAVETLADGRGCVAMGALFLPGEIRLASGACLASPPLFASVSRAGLSGLSQHFHRYLRARPEHQRLRAKPRPVHYNSWEAVYFDHDPAVLIDLASRAAAVGVERFVLDDGWFLGRRTDRAGLGDWQVDPVVWPQGLGRLADHVTALGMGFGLWVEPEMVNPDSALYRANPEWVLAAPPAPQLEFRHQLVLDFGRAEVRAHIFNAIDALLSEFPITYLKWDMNRDISHPGGVDGRAGSVAHVEGLYAVLDRLRAAHPGVDIESCASGGGRADYGILARTDRIWTSDSNDALDRLAIQRGFSHFFPAELMGAHVGPATCHITGRKLSMSLRVATALFGHMGIELDLRDLSEAEVAELTAGVTLHKAHRALIHSGELMRLSAMDGANAFAIIAADRRETLVAWTLVAEQRDYFPPPLRLVGLAAEAEYHVEMVWPLQLRSTWPLADGGLFSGAALMQAGLQMPRLQPGTVIILHLRQV